MSIPSLIAYVVYTAIVATLIVALVRSFFRYKKLLADSMQLALDKVILLQMVQEAAQNKEDTSVEKTEGFLKFVSESRDWAFTYIEQTQATVHEFGDVLEPMLREDFLGVEDINTLSKAYAKLTSILPENTEGTSNEKV